MPENANLQALDIKEIEAKVAELSATITRYKVKDLSAFSAGDCTNGCTGGCTNGCTGACTGGCFVDPVLEQQQLKA